MILCTDHELACRSVLGGIAVTPLPVRRILTREHIPFSQGFHNLIDPTEVNIVSILFPGKECMNRMMKVIYPLGIEPIPAQFSWSDKLGIVETALGNQIELLPYCF